MDAELDADLAAPPTEESAIRCSRGQSLGVAVICLIGSGLFVHGAVRIGRLGGSHVWIGIGIMLVMAMVFLLLGLWGWQSWRRPPVILLITDDGLILAPDSRRPQVLPWQEFRRFEIIRVSGRRVLAIEACDTAEELRRLSPWTRLRMRLVALSGHGRIRPVMAIPDGLEIELEKLAGMLASRTGAVQKE